MPASLAAVAVAAPGEAAELRTGAAEPGKAWSKPAEADNANGPAQKHPEARKHPPIGHFEGTPQRVAGPSANSRLAGVVVVRVVVGRGARARWRDGC
jgi:hypothetical protein